MLNISIKRFNNTKDLWESRIAAGDYNNSIVFAKVWSSTTEKELIIYAGKDINNGIEYQYKISDFDKFIELENLLKIDSNGNFTSSVFQTALHNYIESESNKSGTFLNSVKNSIVWNDVDGQINN